MFVRKNRNRSGSVSVQVVSKTGGAYRVVRSFGSSEEPREIKRLVAEAEAFITHPDDRQSPLFALRSRDDEAVLTFAASLSNADVRTAGPDLIFGELFDRIGFGAIPGELFRHLVVVRLAYPASKLKTLDYLERYSGISYDEDATYRFLDTLARTHKEAIERISFEHTKKTLGAIAVLFYDMTTLYFESEEDGDTGLRKKGFSKDGKFDCPQIMVGLLVSADGRPIGYDLFKGNTFEGRTLVSTIEAMCKKFDLDRPVVVADAAMLSKRNIADLVHNGYTFVIGGRIKNESAATTARIREKARGMTDGASFEIMREDGTRLIVTYAADRAYRDAKNREKGVAKLKARVASGNLTKKDINARGCNKFLALSGEVAVSVDETKISEDARWDGLKGYVTNSDLPTGKLVERYRELWKIERAFRVSKHDLAARPVYHRKRERIEAHLCIVFSAYAVWKELEYLLEKADIRMSPRRAADLTHTMYEIAYTLPTTRERARVLLRMDNEQRLLYDVIHKKGEK